MERIHEEPLCIVMWRATIDLESAEPLYLMIPGVASGL